MLAPPGQRHTELPDSWGQWGPQFPTVPLPSGRSAPSLEFRKPPVGTLGAGMLDFLTWCSSAGGLRAGPHSSFRKEDGGRVCFPPPLSSDRNQLDSTPTTPAGPITTLEPLAAEGSKEQAVTTRSSVWRSGKGCGAVSGPLACVCT